MITPVLCPIKSLLSTSSNSKFNVFKLTTSPLKLFISTLSSKSNGLVTLIYIPEKKLNIISLKAIVNAADINVIIVTMLDKLIDHIADIKIAFNILITIFSLCVYSYSFLLFA